MTNSQDVINILKEIRNDIAQVVSFDLNKDNLLIFDFTESNSELKNVDISNTEQFTEYTFNLMRKNKTPVAIGRYNEDRVIYKRSSLFDGQEARSIHMAIDVWAEATTPIFSPLPGKIHSFQNNDNFGDYGPTIILEHNINNVIFYTLYGHLTPDSIENIEVGQEIEPGQEIARIGNYPENGSWPPHLHFQIITDMQGRKGDFPGVSTISNKNKWLRICPDPNLILKIKNLQEL